MTPSPSSIIRFNPKYWLIKAFFPRLVCNMNLLFQASIMMTSSNANIFRVTALFLGESTGHRWIPSPRPVARSFGVFYDAHLNKRLSKEYLPVNRYAGDLRRHRSHYDTTVMRVPIRNVTQAAIIGTKYYPCPYLLVKPMQLIWRSDTRSRNIRCPI